MKLKHLLNAAMAVTALMPLSCSSHSSKPCWRDMTIEQKLEHMRADTGRIRKLDSLAQTALGPGAKCLDAVKHLFSYGGRLWVYNQDWGGVLEVPDGCVPADDRWQADMSYHGSGMFTPDSLAYINHYEGLQTFSYDEFKDMIREGFGTGTGTIITSFREESVRFGDGFISPAIIIETMNPDGIEGYCRYIFRGPEAVTYEVSVQYPAGLFGEYEYLREMADRYPFGPSGQNPVIMTDLRYIR